MPPATLARRFGGTLPALVLRGLLLLLPAALCLWSLAYQVPLQQTTYVGGEVALRRRFDDAPFFKGINGPEPGDQVADPAQPGASLWWWELLARTGVRPYRWTTAETVFSLPGAGYGRYTLEILAGGRPGGAVTDWTAGPKLHYALTLPEGPARRYRLLAASDEAGDLRVTFRTPPYAAPGDARELGFVLHELRVARTHSPFTIPAWPQLGWLALALACVLSAALAAGAPLWGAGGLASLGALAVAYTLVFHRSALTLFTPTVALLAGLCAAASLGGWWAARKLEPRHTWASDLGPVVGLVAAACALRMAGMLHPHALYSDTGLQANKLYEASLGQIFLTAGLPSDAGGGQAPYPPGPFLILMPLTLLCPAGRAARIVLMQSGTALLDSLTIALLWLMLRRANVGRRAALLGAACYLLPIPALESFSVGELANLGGQALAMPLIAMLALGVAAANKSPAASLGLTIALLVGLVAHSGVTLSVGALMAAAWGLAVGWAVRRRTGGPFSVVRLSMVATVALGLALLCYYSAPVYVGALLGRNGTSGAGTPLGQILSETVRAVLGFAPPNRRALALPTLLGLAALAGLGVLWANQSGRTAALRATLAAWWLGTLLTQGLLLVADQGVRWAIFLTPALSLGAGVLLASLGRRGRAGRLVAGLVLGAILGYGLATWGAQVRDYYHI